MDASTTAAVLAIVVEESQQAAMQALLQERERQAMTAAHHESYLAQRHYVLSRQRLLPERPLTWQDAYERRHVDYLNKEDVMRDALRALQRGDAEAAERYLAAEMGSASESDEADEEMSEADATDGESTAAGEEEEEENMEDDAEIEP